MQEKILLDGKELSEEEIKNLDGNTIVGKVHSENVSTIGTLESVKDMTLESMKLLDIPPHLIYRG